MQFRDMADEVRDSIQERLESLVGRHCLPKGGQIVLAIMPADYDPENEDLGRDLVSVSAISSVRCVPQEELARLFQAAKERALLSNSLTNYVMDTGKGDSNGG